VESFVGSKIVFFGPTPNVGVATSQDIIYRRKIFKSPYVVSVEGLF
jgi:hypothetical protein